MYGLPQVGILAYKLLVKHLEKHGYHSCPMTTGLWKHKQQSISFVFTIDDFEVKYVRRHNAVLLINALLQHYEISIDGPEQNTAGWISNGAMPKISLDIHATIHSKASP